MTVEYLTGVRDDPTSTAYSTGINMFVAMLGRGACQGVEASKVGT